MLRLGFTTTALRSAAFHAALHAMASGLGTVFGGEDRMNVNGGKGLWHSAIQNAPMGHRPPAQRCGSVATLGYISNQSNNLNEAVSNGVGETRKRNGHNPVGVGDVWRTVTRVARSSQPWALSGHSPVEAGTAHRLIGLRLFANDAQGVKMCFQLGFVPIRLVEVLAHS